MATNVPPKIHVSKIDAARRQIETAVNLFFSYADPVSIHTLASAAYNILNDISDNRRAEIRHIRKGLLERVKPEHYKEVLRHLRSAENFFKHADKDPEESYSLNPETTEFVLLDAAELYIGLTGEMPPLLSMFRNWWIARHRRFLIDKSSSTFKAFEENADLLQNRREFFTIALPAFTRVVSE